MVPSVKPADPASERAPSEAGPRGAVALVNLGLLALVAAASFAYWLVTGTAHYLPAALFAAWCLVVQFVLRLRQDPRSRRRRRQRLENAAIGTLCILVLISAVAVPLMKLLPR